MLHAGAGSDPVVDAAAGIQQWLATTVTSLGWPVFAAAIALLLSLGLFRRGLGSDGA